MVRAALLACLTLAACAPEADVPGSDGLLVDEVGRPLAGWTIEGSYEKTLPGGQRERGDVRTLTDADGRFPIFKVAADSRLDAVPPGAHGRVRRPLRVDNRDPADHGLRLALTRGTRITGLVVGAPAPREVVHHIRAVIRRHGATEQRVVDAFKSFELSGLETDDVVDLSVERPGHDPARLTDVVPGSDVVLDLVPRPARIRGVVLDTAGRPIALAWVRFTPREGGVVEQTLVNLDGEFEERWTLDIEYDVTVLVPHPTKPYGPGMPAGRVKGGTSGLVLRVQR